ncbi:MAG TPA: hypothetical protein VHY37_03680 [Tepidisphaeraceae bacterium]|jgi:hypothetical protein|nr:hypothetical protein [Tepidisphaeraceae bacterium]
MSNTPSTNSSAPAVAAFRDLIVKFGMRLVELSACDRRQIASMARLLATWAELPTGSLEHDPGPTLAEKFDTLAIELGLASQRMPPAERQDFAVYASTLASWLWAGKLPTQPFSATAQGFDRHAAYIEQVLHKLSWKDKTVIGAAAIALWRKCSAGDFGLNGPGPIAQQTTPPADAGDADNTKSAGPGPAERTNP